MEKIFRVFEGDTFPSTGTYYSLLAETGGDLHVGDVLFDLRKNRFRIAWLMSDEDFYGQFSAKGGCVRLDEIDGCKIHGDLLMDCVPSVNFLFCENPLIHGQVDEQYADEFDLASILHRCALLDFEAIQNGHLKMSGDNISGLTIYRGRMLTQNQYQSLYEQLTQQHIVLINSLWQYMDYQFLPKWYREFESETIPSAWTDSGDEKAAIDLAHKLKGAYVIKDYAKSPDYERDDEFYIPNTRDKVRTQTVISNFINSKGSDLVGGVVFRKYVPLKRIGYIIESGLPILEEYRAFILAGRVLVLNQCWSGEYDASLSTEERSWVDSVAARVTSNFATMDIARKEDGTLIVTEMGDGQVSGLQRLSLDDFYCTI